LRILGNKRVCPEVDYRNVVLVLSWIVAAGRSQPAGSDDCMTGIVVD
jgi:hypothetical protein